MLGSLLWTAKKGGQEDVDSEVTTESWEVKKPFYSFCQKEVATNEDNGYWH